jgi:putative ABC transport system substrate-binding protein
MKTCVPGLQRKRRGIGRREFIALAGGVAATFAARAQLSLPVIGFLSSRSASDSVAELAAFKRGLKEIGFVEGENVTIEYRWADNRYDNLPKLAADLVALGPAAIATAGGPVTGLAVKTATSTIPFTFLSGIDPVKLGLVDSFNRPSGNATGVNLFITAVESKRLGLLHELMPKAASIAVIANSKSPEVATQLKDVQGAAEKIGVELKIMMVGNTKEIEDAFSGFGALKIQAMLVCADPFFNSVREQFVGLAARHSMPAVYESRSYATGGGLMSYGPNLPDMYRQVGSYIGKMLRGVKPFDLPVIQPRELELVINLKTAKTLGLEIPPMLIARAEEVIE